MNWKSIKAFFGVKSLPEWEEIWREEAVWRGALSGDIKLKYTIERNLISGEYRLLHSGKNSDKHVVYSLAKIQLKMFGNGEEN